MFMFQIATAYYQSGADQLIDHNKMYTRSGKLMVISAELADQIMKQRSRKGIDYFLEEKTYSKWTPQENKVYAQFLEENINEFSGEKSRRTMKFFTRMSKALNINRTNEQCRSHHQKMMSKYKTVEMIIENILFPGFATKQQEKTPIKVQFENFEGVDMPSKEESEISPLIKNPQNPEASSQDSSHQDSIDLPANPLKLEEFNIDAFFF